MIVVAAIRMGDMLSSWDKRLVGFEQPRRSFVLTCFILEVIGVNIKDVLFTFFLTEGGASMPHGQYLRKRLKSPVHTHVCFTQVF